MKIKNKGKVHPSPPLSSSSYVIPSSPNRDALSMLNLLPAAILALASILTLQDREVLAYMITRSLKTTTTTTSPSTAVNDSKKKCKKPSQTNSNITCNNIGGAIHKPPLFDCDCFDCYTCYWFRWDSSPNRELIHQAIEAFEDHLSRSEQSKKIRGKKKEKPSRRLAEKTVGISEMVETKISITFSPETDDSGDVLPSEEDGPLVVLPENADVLEIMNKEDAAVDKYIEMAEDVMAKAADNNHKVFARKVLPDVLGLFNSRLWNLWSPSV